MTNSRDFEPYCCTLAQGQIIIIQQEIAIV